MLYRSMSSFFTLLAIVLLGKTLSIFISAWCASSNVSDSMCIIIHRCQERLPRKFPRGAPRKFPLGAPRGPPLGAPRGPPLPLGPPLIPPLGPPRIPPPALGADLVFDVNLSIGKRSYGLMYNVCPFLKLDALMPSSSLALK